MNEEMWQMLQIMMWCFGIQTTLLIAVMGALCGSFNKKIDKIGNRLDSLEGNMQSMNTRMAVFESKLSDMSANVTHLMWHNQAYPHKDEREE